MSFERMRLMFVNVKMAGGSNTNITNGDAGNYNF